MSVQSIAAAVSEESAESDQKNRSGPNFQFLNVPSSGEITSIVTSGITATLMHDIGGGNDEVISSVSDNGTFDAGKVETGANYYIASPNGATSNFVVYFNGNV